MDHQALSSFPAGPWDEEHVKVLLRFPRYPLRLIQQEPWQVWIAQRGGFRAVYDYLQGYPFAPSHARILDVVLAMPEAVADVYADQLHMSRATYFYRLRELLPLVAQALNLWEVGQTAPPAPSHSTSTASASHSSPLPTTMTTLIGVSALLERLAALLERPDVRLLTLLGPGGSGKTRLAIALAQAVAPEQTSFVDLAGLHVAAELPDTLLRGLGIPPESGQTALATLSAWLRERPLLLILDTFERVLPAAPLLLELLDAAPQLRLLVTSRVALRLYGAQEFRVPLLELPERADNAPAVALFVERARAAQPTFELSTDNAAAVAELCSAMEGLPLAIELVAAQIKFFAPQALVMRLMQAQRLRLLTQGPRNLPPRQQSLRASFDWSYALLPPPLQALFERLAVFCGAFTTADALGVEQQRGLLLDPPIPPPDPEMLHAQLTTLAEHSLLEPVASADAPGFALLELVREYAHERLAARGEQALLYHAHARYYLEWTSQTLDYANALRLPAQAQLVSHAYANLRQAIEWALEQQHNDLALQFVVLLWDFWAYHGHHSDGWQFAQAVLEQTAAEPSVVRARVFRLMGWLAHDLRDYPTMRHSFQASLELTQALDDQLGLALSLHGSAELAHLGGDWAQSRADLERSLVLLQALNEFEQQAWTYDHLGRLAFAQGHLDEARSQIETSLELFQQLPPGWGRMYNLAHLGRLAFYAGQLDEAAGLLQACLRHGQHLGAARAAIFLLAQIYLAACAAEQNQPAAAEQLSADGERCEANGYLACAEQAAFVLARYALRHSQLIESAGRLRQALRLQQTLREPWRMLLDLELAATLLEARADWQAAARLSAAVQRWRTTLGVAAPPLTTGAGARFRAALTPAALAEARAAGASLSLEQAIAYALRCLALFSPDFYTT